MKRFVKGHELYGEIVRLGSSFASASSGSNKAEGRPKGYATYRVGMKVIATFSVSCLECEYCIHGFTSRCVHSQLLGSPALPGAQAQFIRIPKAGGTLIEMDSSDLPPETAILLADILPTGYFATLQAFQHPNLASFLGRTNGLVDSYFNTNVVASAPNKTSVMVFAVVGLGPVGVCALVSLIDFMVLQINGARSETNNGSQSPPPKLTFEIIAIDLQEARREQARKFVEQITEESWASEISVKFLSPNDAVADSCHAVLEAVGSSPTLALSSQLARPFGVISSVGVHSNPVFPVPTPLLYDKNLSFAFGRCPVRTLLERSREVLARRQNAFKGFVGTLVPLSEAPTAYERFEKNEGGKVCFAPWA